VGRELPLADNFRSRPALLAFVNGLGGRIFVATDGDRLWRVRWSRDQRLRPRRDDVTPAADAGPAGLALPPRPSIRVLSLAEQIGSGSGELLAAHARALEARVIAATIAEL